MFPVKLRSTGTLENISCVRVALLSLIILNYNTSAYMYVSFKFLVGT